MYDEVTCNYPHSTNSNNWLEDFQQVNDTWLKQLEQLRFDLVVLLSENLNLLSQADISGYRKLQAGMKHEMQCAYAIEMRQSIMMNFDGDYH